MWDEALQIQQDEERNADSERKWEERAQYDEHEPTTYERAIAEDEQQADYERDDKIGAI